VYNPRPGGPAVCRQIGSGVNERGRISTQRRGRRNQRDGWPWRQAALQLSRHLLDLARGEHRAFLADVR
jgi:hypothetical protein